MNKEQIEIERKYIIAKPDIEKLRGLEGFSESEIEQIYLRSEAGVTHRVRKRVFSGKTQFTETVKERIDRMSAVEREREISENEYISLAARIADGTVPIIKKRCTFDFCRQTFEIDLYPLWKRTAIMETELKSRDETAVIPDFITVIREVTGEKAYSNAAMSKNFPKEDSAEG